MASADLYLSLGSNLGDREENLRRAVALLDEKLGCRYKALSGTIETEAWHFKGGKFLNCVVLYKIRREEKPVSEAAEDILRICKEIEREMGRTDAEEYDAEGKRIYHSRPIDIDILFYGKECIDTDILTVPHKGIGERDFVLIPLREIARPSLKKAFPEYFTTT